MSASVTGGSAAVTSFKQSFGFGSAAAAQRMPPLPMPPLPPVPVVPTGAMPPLPMPPLPPVPVVPTGAMPPLPMPPLPPTPDQAAWNSASGRLATVRGQVADLGTWGSAAAAGHKASLDEIDRKQGAGQYAPALTDLTALEAPLAASHKTAKALFDWTAFEATPAYAATKAEIARLDGWQPAAKVSAAGFTGDLAALRTTAVTGEDVAKAKGDFTPIAAKVTKAAADWTLVRRHNVEMAGLTKGLAYTARIPGRGDASHALAPQWTALDAARAAAPNPAIAIAGCDGLAALRQTVRDKAEALRTAYEAGAAPADAYYNARRSALLDTDRQLYQQASCVPVKNPAMAALMRGMLAEYDAGAINASGTAKVNYTNTESALAKARQLIAMRTTADATEAAYFAQYSKIEKLVLTAAAETDATEPTAQRITDFKVADTALKAKLAGIEATRFTECQALLPNLQAKAEAVLDKKTGALRTAASAAASRPAGTATEKTEKSEAARTAITGADPAVLARLTPDEKLSLLASLRAEPMPASGAATKGDPKRVALRTLYKAMTFDAKFIEKDEENRKAVVDALMASNKKEFQDARANWTVMTADQRTAVLQKVVDAQCKQMAYAKPAPGGASSFACYADATDGDNGRYSISGDIIKINTEMPVFNDFELALDLVFHENTHNYQRKLTAALKAGGITTDPPLTQAKMFAATWIGTNAYVSGDEDYDGYQAQPIEAHAWLAGPQSSQMLLDAL